MPISHVSLPTGPKNYKAMKEFYTAILAPLNYAVFMEHEGVIGYRQPRGGPDLWLHAGKEDFALFDGNLDARGGRTHLAFEAKDIAQIKAWHKAAVAHGATSNGAPGERPHYTKGYYAAFVIDPLGNNIEVMYWQPLWLKAVKSTPYVATAVLGAALAYGANLLQSGALDGIIENVKTYGGNTYKAWA